MRLVIPMFLYSVYNVSIYDDIMDHRTLLAIQSLNCRCLIQGNQIYHARSSRAELQDCNIVFMYNNTAPRYEDHVFIQQLYSNHNVRHDHSVQLTILDQLEKPLLVFIIEQLQYTPSEIYKQQAQVLQRNTMQKNMLRQRRGVVQVRARARQNNKKERRSMAKEL